MKIIILAAGIGSRLGNPFPKPLTPLKNGKSIMKMQIENLSQVFDIESISVLKGAAASIYGTRGANGAILIEMKNQ